MTEIIDYEPDPEGFIRHLVALRVTHCNKADLHWQDRPCQICGAVV